MTVFSSVLSKNLITLSTILVACGHLGSQVAASSKLAQFMHHQINLGAKDDVNEKLTNKHIGEAVCQSFYDYKYFFNFISLSKLDNSSLDSAMINEIKDSENAEDRRIMF